MSENFFSRKSEHAVLNAGCKNYRAAFVLVSFFGYNRESVAFGIDGHSSFLNFYYRFDFYFGSLMKNLFQHLIRKFVSRKLRETRNVFYLWRMCNLSAESGLFYYECTLSVSHRIERCGHSRGTSANNYYVVHVFLLH